jgi:hypothetical protein
MANCHQSSMIDFEEWLLEAAEPHVTTPAFAEEPSERMGQGSSMGRSAGCHGRHGLPSAQMNT